MTDLEKFETLFDSTGIEYDIGRDGEAYYLMVDRYEPFWLTFLWWF
jgi:hypothetical protein